MRLNLIFLDRNAYEKAKSFFQTESNFYAEEYDKHKMLSFEVSDPEDANQTEQAVEKELIRFDGSLRGYHFETEYDNDDEVESYDIDYKPNKWNESRQMKRNKLNQLIERLVENKLNEAGNTFTVIQHRNGRESEVTKTLPELINYFKYTLEVGKYWEREKGNKKIDMNPKSISSLIKNLNNAKQNAAANGHSDTWYSLKESLQEARQKSNGDKWLIEAFTAIKNLGRVAVNEINELGYEETGIPQIVKSIESHLAKIKKIAKIN